MEQLALHLRQLGWLHAIPQPIEAHTARKASRRRTPDRRCRLERMQAAAAPVPLPPPGPLAWLLGLLWSLRPAQPGAHGLQAISWAEAAAWSACQRDPLPPGLLGLLPRLSSDYVSALRAAEAPHAPAPWAADGASDRALRHITRAAFDAHFASLTA